MNISKFEILNDTKNELISDILKDLITIFNNENIHCEMKKEINPKKKGDIIIQILINISSAALYEFLKYVINNIKNRNDYDDNLTMTINNNEIKLKNIDKETKEKK